VSKRAAKLRSDLVEHLGCNLQVEMASRSSLAV
jgi:hypothetical protein